MTVSGHIYGVVLNDRAELGRLAPQFGSKPYAASPRAPVVYMKPRSTIGRGIVRARPGEKLRAASTLALLFARDAVRCTAETALDCVGAACLALDFSEPQASYYRPAIAQANRDGFLTLGDWMPPVLPKVIETHIDNILGHSWSLDQLAREPAQLIAELSAFMTLRAGDALLVGLPGDAPHVRGGQLLSVSAPGLPALDIRLEEALP